MFKAQQLNYKRFTSVIINCKYYWQMTQSLIITSVSENNFQAEIIRLISFLSIVLIYTHFSVIFTLYIFFINIKKDIYRVYTNI